MDSSGGPSRPVTRGVKRALEKEKKEEKEKTKRIRSDKRTMKGFPEPRLTESAMNPGTKVILIGRNDILVDPKNPQKIRIPDDTRTKVKVEVKQEQAPRKVKMEKEPSTSGFPNQVDGTALDKGLGGSDRPAGADTTKVTEKEKRAEAKAGYANVPPSLPNQFSAQVGVQVDKEDHIREGNKLLGVEDGEEISSRVGSTVGRSKIVIQNAQLEAISQGECKRCRGLETRLKETEKKLGEAEKMKKLADKKNEEKNLRIRELELELESVKQSNQDLSKRIFERDFKSAAEIKKIFDTDRSNNYNGTTTTRKDEGKWKSFIRSISSGDSTDEDIDALVVKAPWKSKNGDTILHVAARTGNVKAVKHFVSIEGFKGDVNSKNGSGSTPIMEAAKAKRNFAEIASHLVAKGADLNATNDSGENALYIALTSSQIPLTEIEKVFGTLTSSICGLSDKLKETVLHKEAQRGNLKALEYYMSLKPDPDVVNAINADEWTPILESVRARNFSRIVDLLVKNGANFDSYADGIIYIALQFKKPLRDIMKLVDVGAPWNKNSVLCYCIAAGHDEALKYFITKGADVNAMTNEGLTPVLIATFENTVMGRSCFMKILIKNGAKPLQRLHMTHSTLEGIKRIYGGRYGRQIFSLELLEKLSKQGVTWDNWMIHECSEERDWEVIRYCILKGADVNTKDSFGRTPLMRAVTTARMNVPKIVDLLVAKGANVNEKDEEGFSILHHTANKIWIGLKSLDTVKLLISHGATLSTGVVGSGTRKESILHAAVRGRDPNIVKYMISMGVDLKARDNNGDTPFLLLMRERFEINWSCYETLEILVNGGADPNDRDKAGNNALLIQTRRNIRIMSSVKILVKLGCDWRVPNNDGVTVLSKLEKEGDSEFLTYFRSLD